MFEDEDFLKLVFLGQAHCAFQLLRAGVELGLFDYVAKCPDCTASDISRGLHIKERPARTLLSGLCFLGLIRHEENGYRNANVAEKFLTQNSPIDMKALLRWQHEIVYPGVHYFLESLENDSNLGIAAIPGTAPSFYPRLDEDSRLGEIFQQAMHALSSAADSALVKNKHLASATHLIDLGGGSGTNAIALAKEYPALRITIFDLPNVCSKAEERIRQEALGERVKTHAGDFFEKDFPKNADCILFAHFPNFPSDKQALILSRAFDALVPRGVVVFYFDALKSLNTEKTIAALEAVYFMAVATGEGALYSLAEHQQFLTAAGFNIVANPAASATNAILVGQKP